MNIICIALGKQYELEAQRLLKEYPEAILVTNETPNIETSYSIPVLNGLMTKSNFASFLPSNTSGPIFLCDADLFPNVPNPLQYFKVSEDTDVAFVPYSGTWHFPEQKMNDVIKVIPKINSGFMYFRNLEIAQEVSSGWNKQYKERIGEYLSGKIKKDRVGEYDEPSLMIWLYDHGRHIKLEGLEKKWNNWEKLNIETYFHHGHLNNYCSYSAAPTLKRFEP
jgi:hypothetical protein